MNCCFVMMASLIDQQFLNIHTKNKSEIKISVSKNCLWSRMKRRTTMNIIYVEQQCVVVFFSPNDAKLDCLKTENDGWFSMWLNCSCFLCVITVGRFSVEYVAIGYYFFLFLFGSLFSSWNLIWRRKKELCVQRKFCRYILHII